MKKNSNENGKDGVLPQLRIESELMTAFTAACKKRPLLNRSDVIRHLIIHFVKNPDMKFEI